LIIVPVERGIRHLSNDALGRIRLISIVLTVGSL
jgi:hypothetical protein